MKTLLKIGIPAAKAVYYAGWQMPKQFLITEASFRGIFLSFFGKFILWIGSFLTVGDFDSQDFGSNFDFLSRVRKDPLFMDRFGLWAMGSLPVFGALADRWVGYASEWLINAGRIPILAAFHIEFWNHGAGYSVYLAIEEWVKVMGNIYSAGSGLLLGGEGFGAGIALGVTTIGLNMHFIRACLETKGKRNTLLTGIDLS